MIHNFENFWKYTDTVEGWLFKSEAELIYLCASSVPSSQSIVEIGSYKGRSTSVLAFGSQGARIYSVDPHDNEIAFVQQGLVYSSYEDYCNNLDRLGIPETLVKRVLGYSYEYSEEYDGPKVGMLFIDGYHSTEAVLQDFLSWEKHLADDAIVYFDDSGQDGVGAGIHQLWEMGKLPPIRKDADKGSAYLHQINIDRQPMINNY